MKMRHVMAGLAVTTLVLGSTSAAMAWGHRGSDMDGYRGDCGGNCYYNNNGNSQAVTPEQQQAAQKLVQEHVAAMEPLRQQLEAKRLELDALSRNPNAKPETITKLSEEVAQLSAQLRKSGLEFRTKLGNEAGIQNAPRGGMGMGSRGNHMRGTHHWDN